MFSPGFDQSFGRSLKEEAATGQNSDRWLFLIIILFSKTPHGGILTVIYTLWAIIYFSVRTVR